MEAADKTEREELQWMRSNMTTSEQKTKLIKPLREQQKPVSEKAETHSSLSVRQFGTGESQITANAGQVQPKEGTHLSIAGAQPRPESLRHNTHKFVWNIN
jgi:UDP-2,3-diacylglucosamine pyrophosphatase LpxH